MIWYLLQVLVQGRWPIGHHCECERGVPEGHCLLRGRVEEDCLRRDPGLRGRPGRDYGRRGLHGRVTSDAKTDWRR